MGDGTTNLVGIVIPSTNAVFLTVVGVHILAGTRLHGHRRRCDAKSETYRSPSPGRDHLFLVPGRRLSDRDQLGGGTLGGKLPSVYSWGIVVCGRLFRPSSPTATLALLGQAAHQRNGRILRFAPDRVLRGQRQKPAALERASSDCILAIACGRWNSTHCPRLVMASAGPSAGPALIKTGRPYFHYSRNTI
jgi:hypothetical protein